MIGGETLTVSLKPLATDQRGEYVYNGRLGRGHGDWNPA